MNILFHRIIMKLGNVLILLFLLVLIPEEVPVANAQANTLRSAPNHPTSANTLALLANCPPSLGFGETIQCSILSAGETDSYTFTANAGDKVLVRMGKSSGTFYPGIQVYDSDGTKLCEGTSYINYSWTPLAEIAGCALPGDGTYSIRAFDAYNGTQAGDYFLHLQRLNSPGNPAPITFGQTLSNQIATTAEMDAYTFTANAGDKVIVRMGKSSGTFYPGIRVYGPDGTKLCEGTSYINYSWTPLAEIAGCALPSYGTYSVLAFDAYNGTQTGDYSLHLQRLNNPGSPASVSFGQTLANPITTAAEMDTYTFTANAGDKVLVRMSKSSGTYYPGIRVYGPDGTKLCEATSYINYSWTQLAEIANCALPGDGTYSILAFDAYNGTQAGNYSLHVQRLNNPGSPVSIGFGQTLPGSVSAPAEADAYTFTANAGDKVIVRMGKSSGTFYPGIRVYGSDGTKLCEATSYINYSWTQLAEIANCALPTNGTYSILAFDAYNGTQAGNYSLHLQRLNNPGNSASIAFGQTLPGSTSAPAEADAYTFTANAGDKIIVRMGKSSGGFYPGIRVYSPDGTKLCEATSYINYSWTQLAEIAGCALPSDGTYSILAFDAYNGTYTGDYSLHLQRLNNPGNPASIAFGQTLPGSMSAPAEADAYTFTANAGDKVLVRMSKSSGTYYPGIRVYGSDGTKLCEATSYINYSWTPLAEIAGCALPSAGTYSILTFDAYNGTQAGNYSLHLQRLNNPEGPVSITFGQTLPGSITIPTETDAYTFTADAGDMVAVRMSRSSGNLYPGIRVLGPDGTQLCENFGSSVATLIDCSLPVSGTHTILAFDHYGTNTGNYSLYLQQNNPGSEPHIAFDVPQEIQPTPDLPVWFQVDVPSNTENLFFTLQKYSSSSGEIKLFSGTQLLAATSGYDDLILRLPAPTAGTYRVETLGSGSGRLTAYTSLPNLPLGQWVVGNIYRSWGRAWYQFSVPSAQSSLHVHVETIGLWSQLQVYRDALNGTLVGTASGPSMNLDIPSPQAGIYYVHLTDSAWIQGSSQTRDHMIRADADPIEPPPCTDPIISNFTPDKGGTAGQVTVKINGQCLDAQSTVQLARPGHNNISATSIDGADDRRSLTATFNLSGATPGNWNLVVTNPGVQSVIASTPFVVESGGEAILWVKILGREVVRTGQKQTVYIEYGNSGNVDAKAVPLWIDGIPKESTWKLDFEVKPPPQPEGQEPVDWDQIPIYVESNNNIAVPLLIPVIPAGYTGQLPIEITIPTIRQVQLKARMDPVGLLCSPETAAENCTSELLKRALGYIPGVSCGIDAFCFFSDVATAQPTWGDVWSLTQGLAHTIISCAKDASLFLKIADAVNDVFSIENTIIACSFTAIEVEMDIEALSSISPEDKYGPVGYDTPTTPSDQLKHWTPASQPLDYRVDFWNKDDAPAATVDVIITDSLDPNLDWSTFKFTEVGFLDWKVPLEPGQYFNVDIPNVSIDLSRYYPGQPTVTMTVNVEGTFDPTTGEIEWEFHALDPITREPPDNPYAGFLPPITNSGWEIGWVKFSASPKAGLASGTVIANQSFVKFDLDVFKPAPAQGPYINTLDAAPPASAVMSPTGIQECTSFPVSWSGMDDTNGSGLRGFDIYVDNLGDADAAYLWRDNLGSHSALFTGVPGTTYAFYTRARDNVGNLESIPEPSGYDVEVTAGAQIVGCNLPPSVPVLLSPASGVLVDTLQPALDWKDSTPVADHYQIQIATNSGFTTGVINETDVLTSAFTPVFALSPGKQYYWRARAFNVIGQARNWSAARNFKTPLGAANILVPSDTQTLFVTRPSFDWDNVAGATSYNIQISPVNTFASSLANATVNASEYNLTKDLPPNKTLFWRVQAKTSAVTGPWSSTRSFTTGNPPSLPVLVLPANNSLVKDDTPLLDWKDCTVPAGTFKHYELQVDDDPAFSSPVVNTTSVTSNFTPPDELAHNTKFYWRVRAVSTIGLNDHLSARSAVWSFRTLVDAPALLSPDNDFHSLTLRPSFDWDTPSGTGAITGYAIQISKNDLFTQIVNTGNPISSFYIPTADLPKDATLYWRVLTKGGNGPSVYSAFRALTTPSNPPPAPVLSLPASNTLVTNYKPTFTWNAVVIPNGTNLQNYIIQVDDNVSFSSPEVNDTASNPSFTPSTDLASNTRYYWRIRAVNTADELSNWSAVRYFRTIIQAPQSLTVNPNPLNPLRPTFEWEDATGPTITSYAIQLSTNASFTTLLVNSTTMDSSYEMLKNLPAGTTIHWRVKVNGANGPSGWTTAQFMTP